MTASFQRKGGFGGWFRIGCLLSLFNLFYFGGPVGGACTTTDTSSSSGDSTDDTTDDSSSLSLTSAETADGFDPGGTIPLDHACPDTGGSDELPTLSWSNVPDGTLSFAITVVDTSTDPDTVHAVLFNIAATATSEDDEDNFTATNSCINYNNTSSYAGPCPPVGETHTYVFTLYALSVDDLVADTGADTSDADDCITKIQANDLESDSISGTFTATQ